MFKYFFFGLIIFLKPLCVFSETYTASYIIDGDTLYVQSSKGERIKIRLKEINTPELAQDYGDAARIKLMRLCLNKPVTLTHLGVGAKGRTTARVYCNGVYADKYMADKGLAWVFVTGDSDPSVVSAYTNARKQRKGLWKSQNPIPPWEFNKRKTSNNSQGNAFIRFKSKNVDYDRIFKRLIKKELDNLK